MQSMMPSSASRGLNRRFNGKVTTAQHDCSTSAASAAPPGAQRRQFKAAAALGSAGLLDVASGISRQPAAKAPRKTSRRRAVDAADLERRRPDFAPVAPGPAAAIAGVTQTSEAPESRPITSARAQVSCPSRRRKFLGGNDRVECCSRSPMPGPHLLDVDDRRDPRLRAVARREGAAAV